MTTAQEVSVPRRAVIVADFNAANLAAILRNPGEDSAIEPVTAPFAQVESVLLDPDHPVWSPRPDLALVWTRPERALPTYERAVAYQETDPDGLVEDVDRFARRLIDLRERVDTIVVPTWLPRRDRRGLGPLDVSHPLGLRRLALEANARLARALDGAAGVFLLDAEDWVSGVEGGPSNDRLDYMAKIPYRNAVFHAAARDVRAVLRSLHGGARKLVVVDLDNTLWGGVVGDDGWEGLTLGGHDPDGEAFADFQSELRALRNRGIVLAIASKNEEGTAFEAIDRHPEMVLRRDDFAAWRIDWNDKARNLREIADELRLGLDAVVFIDDSPAERARVREALPDVLVPEWPDVPARYAAALRALRCFDSVTLTAEDRARGDSYLAGRRVAEARAEAESLEDWLRTLETEIRVEPLSPANLPRAAQLLNKTNQMNLATRRLSETELTRWTETDGREFWTFRVSDRFGDYGLTGLLGLESRDGTQEVTDYVMSCRVLGRNVERSILSFAVDRARANGCRRIRAELIPTERNQPCRELFETSGWDVEGELAFAWNTSVDYPAPVGAAILTEPANRS